MQSPLIRHLEIQFKNDFIKTNVKCIRHTQNMALQMKVSSVFLKACCTKYVTDLETTPVARFGSIR